MIPRRIVTMIGVAGLCASAPAEINWTTQMQFRNRVGTSESAPLAGNLMNVSATGTYTFTVQVGIFNLTGLGPLEANYGLNNWTTTVQATGLQAGETLGVVASSARVVPFISGSATAFAGRLAGPSTIDHVSAARDLGSALWPWDSSIGQPGPTPTLPTNPSPGAQSYVSAWRFQVVVAALEGPDIQLELTGQAGPVVRWGVFGLGYPDDGEPGWVYFIGIAPTPTLRDYAPTTLTLHRVPGPGAAGVLIGAGVWAGCRRRGRAAERGS